MKTKLEQMKELVAQLNVYRDAYYNRQESLVSDHEYDDLYDDLVRLEGETGVVMVNSPTATVGYEVKSKLTKVKHSHPMLSLGKTKDEKDLIKFAGDKNCVLSLKLDGLSILATYEGGKLVKAETRGDGIEGEDVTSNARVFENLPLAIPYEGHFEIEGEAVIYLDDFDRINNSLPKGVEKFKNARNLVSGSVRQLDNRIAKERHIRFLAWKVPTHVDIFDDTYSARFACAGLLGFDVVPHVPYKKGEPLHDLIEGMKGIAKEKNLPIDGMVLGYDDIKYGESLGVTSHHPRSGIAFKFYDDEYESKLIDIEYSMGKTGILSPVAIFEPVEIDGTIVQRASLSNLSVKADTLGIPYKGQPIWITKRNQIIPKIERAIKKDLNDITDEEGITIPLYCPICGSLTEIVQDNDSKVLVCTNPDCKGKLLGKLVHFCSKDGVNIDGLSESTLEKFIELGWVSCFEDIYKLYLHPIESLEGFGNKSAQKLVESIEKSRKISLDKFICALSIPLIGRTASKTIAKYFDNNLDKFLRTCGEPYDFTRLDDFGKTMSDSINKYLDDHLVEMLRLTNYFTFTASETTSDTLSGKTFCITGSLNVFANRDEAKSAIEKAGGKVSSSVSTKTYALVNNDKESTSSKNKKAKELGIPIITEQDLIDMIGGI